MDVRDNRTKLMNEILNGIRIIKFFTWEKPFSENVMKVRSEEVKKQVRVFYRKFKLLEIDLYSKLLRHILLGSNSFKHLSSYILRYFNKTFDFV